MDAFKAVLLLLLMGLLSACNLSSQPPSSEETLATLSPGSKPEVTISSPEDGDEVVVGDVIFVSANARHATGVTRVQLSVNNQIVKTVSSESLAGDPSMNVLLDYRPMTTGDLRLVVTAYRGAVASDPAEIKVSVRSTQSQVTATSVPQSNVPNINPNDPTCRALVNIGLNLREGPGTDYPRITVLREGTVVPIIGRLGDNSWWQVRSGQTTGWVSSSYTTEYGICTSVPVQATAIPPTNTPVPTQTPIPAATQTPIPSMPTHTPSPADLVIPSITGPSELTIPAGATEVTGNYAVTITNTGGSATGRFNNNIYVLPNGTELDLGVVGNLGAGESISLTVAVTFSGSGNYILRAMADSDSEVVELTRANNRSEFDVTVYD